MSQESMGSVMGITQSHYSKVENGKKIISGEELHNLDMNGIDVDYLVSGIKSPRTVLDDLMEACGREKKAELLQLIVWTIQQGMENAQIGGSAAVRCTREIELLRYQVFPHTSEHTVWYRIRMANEMTQGEMAEALDVSVKRYREIEKGNTRASAEVVAALYENLGYLPSIILEEDVVNLSSLNLIWEEFEEELQKELEAFIRKGCGLWECRPGGDRNRSSAFFYMLLLLPYPEAHFTMFLLMKQIFFPFRMTHDMINKSNGSVYRIKMGGYKWNTIAE